MPIPITIPRLGWSMDEGNFTGWLKKEGELVKTGELLFTLESEKAQQDIEAADSGLLQLQPDSPNPGDVVKVGQVIALLISETDSADGATSSISPAAPAVFSDHAMASDSKSGGTTRAASRSTASSRAIVSAKATPAISPRARRRAEELAVDATQLKGSGRTGRIIEADVLKAAASARPAGKGTPAGLGQVSIMRRNIAERTALSFATIPHFYLRAEVDATELVKLRERMLESTEGGGSARVTVTDFLLRAQALALRDFPAANAVWQENRIVPCADTDVGLVVGLPEGLLIPVIRDIQKLSLVQLAQERTRLIEAVRAGRFTAEMLAGGATSLSNLGHTRTDEFAAIIAPHQSSMLAVGRAAPRPYVVDGRLAIRNTIRLCLSVDHRVMDGTPAAEFLGRIVDLLESPKALLDEGASL